MSNVEEQIQELRTELEIHINRSEERNEKMDERMGKLISAQEKNVTSIQELIEETRGVVQLHKDIKGLARVGSRVQDLIAWFMKFGAFGTAIAYGMHWAVEHMEKFGG